MPHRVAVLVAFIVALVAAPTAAHGAYGDKGQRVYDLLPPGQSGAVPPDADSTNQIPLYDNLTPLFDQIGPAQVSSQFFTPAKFGPNGRVTKRERPRSGVTIERDPYGVPSVTADDRDDLMFGAGWATAQDRGTFIEAIRDPARIAALDVPGLDAFALATSLRSFESSSQTEKFLADQAELLDDTEQGRLVRQDIDDYLDGINGYYRKTKNPAEKWTIRDVTAIVALIGSQFGQGGGTEVASSDLLARLQGRLGPADGLATWRDLREVDDPEAPTTLAKRFEYASETPGPAPGAAIVDAGTFSGPAAPTVSGTYRPVPSTSNALLVSANRSVTKRPLAVMGPQLGFFYPQLFMEIDLHGGGIDARGAALPGVSMYVITGRGKDFAWSPTTSAPASDNTDQFLEELCDGSDTKYVYKGRCRDMGTFNAGTLKGAGGEPDQALTFNTTVHGPVGGYVNVQGKRHAVSRLRSTRGRDVLSAIGLKNLNENDVKSAKDFAPVMDQIEFVQNWFYVDGKDIAFYSSGRLPIRAPRTNPSLPAFGTGEYDWRGWLERSQHPQAINPPSGVISNWNNQPAPGWGPTDSEWNFGSVTRAPLLDRGLPRRSDLDDLVRNMNRAATQDVRATLVWPTVEKVLDTGPAPDARSAQAAELISAWTAEGGSRLDRDLDGKIDAPGAAVVDQAWPEISNGVLRPVLGDLLDRFAVVAPRDEAPYLGGTPGTARNGSSFFNGWYSYIDKDLRSLLGEPVRGAYSRRYCGGGDLAACRDTLWGAIRAAADTLSAEQGGDPNAWRADATRERIVFRPGLLGEANTMRWANRPTYQQVLEFKP